MTQNSGKAPCKSEVKLDYITKAASLVWHVTRDIFLLENPAFENWVS